MNSNIIAVLLLFVSTSAFGIERHYYIAVVEQIWDYAPGGNLIYSGDQRHADLYLKHDPDVPLPGTKYKKALYRQFKDETFTEQLEIPEWQGMIGPLMQAEVGDKLIVHFFNTASRNYSIHPHGVFYEKSSEGAFYIDGNPISSKYNDAVPPGGNWTYHWEVKPQYGPTKDDPNCISWLYHSHYFAEPEVMTGPVGIMATCKKGSLDKNGNRKDVQRAFSLLFAIMDENFSFLRSENIEAAQISEKAILDNFMTFQLANRKHSINGYIYGNLPGLDVCLGDKVSLHLAVVGNDLDLHSVFVEGQTMEVYRHKVNTYGLYPGSSKTAIIDVENPGKWLLSCQAQDYIKAGMQAFFNVHDCKNSTTPSKLTTPKGKVRNYYIAAEEVMWNYAPSGYDITDGIPLKDKAPNSFGSTEEGNCQFNGEYKKAIYRGYTDETFTTLLTRDPSEVHLGFLGPVIQAEIGDTVKVHFLNRASRPYSIQFFRLFGSADEEGIQYKDGPDVAVQPNESKIYTKTVPTIVGGTKFDPDCLFGRYYSAVDQVKDSFTGLNGPLVVCKKGKLDAKSRKVDKQFYLLFSNVIETESHYYEENVQRACGSNADAQELAKNVSFINANTMRSMNGFSYGNLPGLRMNQGDSVTWFVTSVGYTKGDMHVPYWHGNTFTVNGETKDVAPLIPDLSSTLQMTATNPGTWLIEDSIHTYSTEFGMMALYSVIPCKDYKPSDPKGTVRTYYIGAVEEEWDYAPNIKLNPVSLVPLEEDEVASLYVQQGETRIGHKYIKAFFREFTDNTFRTQKRRTDAELHMGVLGPYIKAEVGDTIRVVFKNMATQNYSIQAHGVFYNKSNEGQNYQDGTSGAEKLDGSVMPGQVHEYEWSVPENAGPNKDDFNCITWLYVSAVDELQDLNAGLVGPIIICRKGILKNNNLRKDVDREFVLFFYIFNENGSPYFMQNIDKYTGNPEKTKQQELLNPRFIESNIYLGINGYIFGSLPNVTMYLGEVASFYIISLGDPFGTHTVHWHGNTFVRHDSGLHRHDVVDVLPGNTEEVELLGVNPGTWLMHCHVGNHSENGMLMTYQVLEKDD